MRAGLPWGHSPWLPGGYPLHLAFLLRAYIPGASFFVSISSYSHTGLWPTLRDQHWDFFGMNDAKAETPVFWPPHAKCWLIGKDSDAGRDWGQEEKGTIEDEMAGWHHWLDGRESEWTAGVGAGQGGLACCDSWGHKELDTTERLNWSELNDLILTQPSL